MPLLWVCFHQVGFHVKKTFHHGNKVFGVEWFLKFAKREFHL